MKLGAQILLGLLISAVLLATWNSYSSCKAQGGAWVDGVVWYECVEAAK